MRKFGRASVLLALVIAACSSEQPQATVHVELADGERLIDCAELMGSLGRSFKVTLANGMKVSGAVDALGDDGRSKITVKFPAPSVQSPRPNELHFTANLAHQSPTFEYSVPQSPLRFTVLVESRPLLATSRAHSSWKEFQPAMKSNNAFERTVGQCGPRLAAAQTARPAAQLGR